MCCSETDDGMWQRTISTDIRLITLVLCIICLPLELLPLHGVSTLGSECVQYWWTFCFLLVGVHGSSRARSQNVIWEKRGRNNNYNNNNEEDIMMTADIWRLLLRFYSKGAGFHGILRTTPDLPLKWVNIMNFYLAAVFKIHHFDT